jgi:hypothetical protein
MSTFADEQFLAPDANNFVNQSVEYLALRQPIASTSCSYIKVAPSNGGVYTNKSDFVEFRINSQHNSFIDGTKTKLNFDFTATATNPTANTTAFDLYSQGSAMLMFKRYTVISNGETLEDVTDANRILYMMTKMYTSKSQINSSPSIQDLYANELEGAVGGQGTGRALSAALPPVNTTQSVSVPIMLSSLFGPSARKSIPIGMLRNGLIVRFYFTDRLSEVVYAQDPVTGNTLAIGNDSHYTVKNVSLEVKTIRYDDGTFENIKNNLKTNDLEWDATTFISNVVSANPAIPSVRLLLTNSNYRDVKSVYCQSWYSSQVAGSTMTYQSVFPGLYQSNVLVNGEPVNSRNIGVADLTAIKNSIPQTVMNLQTTSRASNEILHTESQLASPIGGDDIDPIDPVDATQILIGYSNITPTTAATNDYPVNGANAVPNNLGPFGNNGAGVGIDVPNYYWGLSTLTSNDKSRELTGRDFRSKQVVLQMDRFNSIVASLDQVIQGILVVGVKYHLDVVTGLLTRSL